ncbi:glycine--tRNA ligase subunit alpha, partial [Francisella tularensis]
MLTFQELILKLHHYGASKGSANVQPFDRELGAGTCHPATTQSAIG